MSETVFSARPDIAVPNAKPRKEFHLELAMETSTTEKFEYICDPYFPRGKVVGSYGRGGTAKSSLLAALLAHISAVASGLWVSSEEPSDWITTRHIKLGGKPMALAVPTVVVRDDQRDADGRPVASSFDVYEDLERVIIQAAETFKVCGAPPLAVVALDAVVALVAWKASESTNSDANVKRLIAYLEYLAQKYQVCIWIIGHANKQQGKGPNAELSDGVMGARAWVDSPRLTFMHFEDKHDENSFVVYSVKSNLGAYFAQNYKTKPIHTMYQREDGDDAVLCGIDWGARIWGRSDGRERVLEAITVEPEGGENGVPKVSAKQQSVAEILSMVLEMFKAGATLITRKDVEARMQREPGSRHWEAAESRLAVFGVTATRGAHGVWQYAKSGKAGE